MLIEAARHEPLAGAPWSESAARLAIRQIVDASCEAFDPLTLWPMHPGDREGGDSDFPAAALYHGATGVLWALKHLRRTELAEVSLDLEGAIAGLLGYSWRFNAAAGIASTSYFLGDAGVLLLQWDQFHDPGTADALFALVESNLHNPTLEALWGSSGTLVAAIHMIESAPASDERARWQALFRSGVDILHAQMHVAHHSIALGRDAWLWTQDLYGQQRDYLGAAHGFAGNVYPVLRGARWLDAQVVHSFDERAAQTLDIAARREGALVSWEPVFDAQAAKLPSRPMVQDCHGAPGIVSRLSGTQSPVLRELLVGAGELIWHAGPLVKPPGLCHGTDGNGYAFLKLHALSGETRWLDRARGFAMHAVQQSEAAAATHGKRRFSLWTGDLGLAVYLSSCIRADAAIPTLDVF